MLSFVGKPFDPLNLKQSHIRILTASNETATIEAEVEEDQVRKYIVSTHKDSNYRTSISVERDMTGVSRYDRFIETCRRIYWTPGTGTMKSRIETQLNSLQEKVSVADAEFDLVSNRVSAIDTNARESLNSISKTLNAIHSDEIATRFGDRIASAKDDIEVAFGKLASLRNTLNLVKSTDEVTEMYELTLTRIADSIPDEERKINLDLVSLAKLQNQIEVVKIAEMISGFLNDTANNDRLTRVRQLGIEAGKKTRVEALDDLVEKCRHIEEDQNLSQKKINKLLSTAKAHISAIQLGYKTSELIILREKKLSALYKTAKERRAELTLQTRFSALNNLRDMCVHPEIGIDLNQEKINQLFATAKLHSSAIKLGTTVTTILEGLMGKQGVRNEGNNYYDKVRQARINSLISFKHMLYDEAFSLNEDELKLIESGINSHAEEIIRWQSATYPNKCAIAVAEFEGFNATYPTHETFERLPTILAHERFLEKAETIKQINEDTAAQMKELLKLLQEKKELLDRLKKNAAQMNQSSVLFKKAGLRLNMGL